MRAPWIVILSGSACVVAAEVIDPPRDAYRADVERWHAARVERLRNPEGWLSLFGLDWIDAGTHVVGSGAAAAVRLPGEMPERIGVLNVSEAGVTFQPEPGVPVADADGELTEARVLDTDRDGDPTVLSIGSVRFYVIERGDRLAVRVKDLAHPRIAAFQGIERYPVDPAWRARATVIAPGPEERVSIPDVTGAETDQPVAGRLRFVLGGSEHTLTALDGGDGFFLVFGDETNGETTYGGGRFLVTEAPDSSGHVVVDFNRAYNPPCVFSPYATCPLPPEENRLSIRVEAGECANVEGIPPHD